MTSLQSGEPPSEEYSAPVPGQHPLSGYPQNHTHRPSYAKHTASNKMLWGCSPSLQQRYDFAKSASDRERLYHLPRPPILTSPMEPPIPTLPDNLSVQNGNREQLEHRQEANEEKNNDTRFREASQQNDQKHPDLQATVDDASDVPVSHMGGCPLTESNLHSREYVNLVSPSNLGSVGTELEIVSPEIFERYQRQTELFQSLERTCTAAAETYWRSQCDSSFFKPLVLRRPRLRRSQRESHPYLTGRIRSLPQNSLASYLSDIARSLWERAQGPVQELEAVYRMGNIYSWGEKITRAARGELGLAPNEEIFKVVIAALDLTSWMLCEEAKAEIVRVLALGEWART